MVCISREPQCFYFPIQNELDKHVNDYNKFILYYITHNIHKIQYLIRYLGKFIIAHKYNIYFIGVGNTELVCKKIITFFRWTVLEAQEELRVVT